MNTFPFDIDHPLFQIISNETRRQIIQLLSIEKNYGNRLAAILNLSPPAIHRHLKLLQQSEKNSKSLGIIHDKEKTDMSYSGRKGATASLLEIDARLGLFFGIFPNYIHSSVQELDKNGDKIDQDIDLGNYDSNLFGAHIDPSHLSLDDTKQTVDISDLNFLNDEIKELERKLMVALYEKNEKLHSVFKAIDQSDDLDFNERVIIKSLIAYGLNNLKLISKMLGISLFEIKTIIQMLKDKHWIVDNKIQPLKQDMSPSERSL